ncbi:hypothetical protein KCU77_g11541, partial [Aureobasidium melanogenum]
MSLPEEFEERDDADYDKLCTPKLTERSNDGYEIKGRCGMPCDCTFWGPTYKRKRTKEADQVGQSDNPDEPSDDQAGASGQAKRNKPENYALLEKHAEVEQQVGYAESPSKLTASRPLWKDYEMEQTSGSQSQRQPMHEELNTMLLTYKYVSKANY